MSSPKATLNIPHPRSLHFLPFLLSLSSPFVHVLGTHGQTGRLATTRVIAYHATQSFLQSLGTQPLTGSFHHHAINQSNFRPFSGGSSGSRSGGPHSGRHQSENQHSNGQTSTLNSGGFGQHSLHHSLSRHSAGGNAGSSLACLLAILLHQSNSEHLGQISPKTPVGTGMAETLDVVLVVWLSAVSADENLMVSVAVVDCVTVESPPVL